jgi:hypothetical protein
MVYEDSNHFAIRKKATSDIFITRSRKGYFKPFSRHVMACGFSNECRLSNQSGVKESLEQQTDESDQHG